MTEAKSKSGAVAPVTSETPVDAERAAAAPAWDAVRRDLDAVAGDLAKLGGLSLDAGQAALSDEVERLRASVADLAARASAESQSALHDVAGAVRQRPLTSITTAFAIGLLFANLLSRRA
jgi:ElaB/YqjD/DUF883 family membrane-anchored ribosome-binding protein